MTHESQSRTSVLRWQSRLLLGLALVPVSIAIAFEYVFFASARPILLQALAFGTLLAWLVRMSRAATLGASFSGGLFTAALYLATPGWRTALWPLVALLILTFAATRFGRARKEQLGIAEARHGRNAAQVTANLGVAALAAIAIRPSLTFIPTLPAILNSQTLRLALIAALAEAAADTLSSELGEVLGGEPFLLTSLRRVPAGTDGAISFAGTFAGVSAALIVAAVASFAFGFSFVQVIQVVTAAVAGLFVDSWLGAVLERRGWLNNDAVNFLSTLSAALFALALAVR